MIEYKIDAVEAAALEWVTVLREDLQVAAGGEAGAGVPWWPLTHSALRLAMTQRYMGNRPNLALIVTGSAAQAERVIARAESVAGETRDLADQLLVAWKGYLRGLGSGRLRAQLEDETAESVSVTVSSSLGRVRVVLSVDPDSDGELRVVGFGSGAAVPVPGPVPDLAGTAGPGELAA